jgi:hypothetical protein
MSSSDYTNMRRLKHMSQPIYSYIDNCSPVYDKNKINCIYVVPNDVCSPSESLVHCEKHNEHHNEHHNENHNEKHCEKLSEKHCEIEHPRTKITSNSNLTYITPIAAGAVTLKVEPNLVFIPGNQVFCTDLSNSNTYFQGVVFNYDYKTGDIIINQITNINGTYGSPRKYNVILLAGNQEIVKLKNLVSELYIVLFNTDITQPINGTYSFVNSGINNLYLYFWNQQIDITNNDITYLTTQINTLYLYFFDVDLMANPTFNPNNNGVVLNNIQIMTSQLYIYLFNAQLLNSLTFIPFTL